MEKTNITKHIGNKFQEYRLKNNLTQKELADKLYVTYQAVSKWENNKSIPDISILQNISNAYKITPDIILYDLLDEDLKKDVSIYAENFKKLNQKDKKSILHFIDYFLSR